MSEPTLECRATWALERIASALESIIESGVLKMKDVDRAKVYSTHLGEKLRANELEEKKS